MPHRFQEIDVFTRIPLKGNPLAVVHDAGDMSEGQMQALAHWTNFSETSFLLPPTQPQADYRLRIFTPRGELPFAGHPTLGSCLAWLSRGVAPKAEGVVVQECGVGLVKIRKEGERLAFAAPPLIRTGPLDPGLLEQIAAGLRIDKAAIRAHQCVDNGPGWCAVMLGAASDVLALQPDFSLLQELKLGVVAPQPPGSDSDYEVRAFVADLGVEDPVTGSLNAAIAQWFLGAGIAQAPYVVTQGTALGRSGRVFIDAAAGEIWVGGHSTILVEGEIAL